MQAGSRKNQRSDFKTHAADSDGDSQAAEGRGAAGGERGLDARSRAAFKLGKNGNISFRPGASSAGTSSVSGGLAVALLWLSGCGASG